MRPSFQPVANDVALKCLPTREDRSVVRCSIQLSYGRKNPILPKKTPSNAAVTCCFTCMVGNFISRRHDGREGLTIFASSRRQTLESAFVLLLVADKRSRRRESAHRQWETAEKLKSKSGYATIGDIIERYQSHAEDRPPTIRNNISALRMLVRTVRGGDPDLRSFEFSLAQIPHRLYGYVNYRY